MTTAQISSTPEIGSSDGSPDLFERVVGLGSKHEKPILSATLGLAVLLHVAFGGAAALRSIEVGAFAAQVRAAAALRFQQLIEIETVEPPPEPPPAPEPPPPEPETLPPVEAPPEAVTDAPAPAPAAAEAAAVLTAPDDAPLNLTDQGFISGSGTRFAGGVTAANGTSSTAVRTPGAIANGVPNAVGTTPGTAAASRARGAGLLRGSGGWDAPFPPEADAEQINQATVRLVVVVGRDGRPKSATVVDDPGYGFGRQAKRHAMTQMFEPALDSNGNPIEAATPPFKVRFQR